MTLEAKELKHVQAVVDYLYSDEVKHYEKEGRPEEHIFVSVRALQEIVWRNSPAEIRQSRKGGCRSTDR